LGPRTGFAGLRIAERLEKADERVLENLGGSA
jgi:hypothetical protein